MPACLPTFLSPLPPACLPARPFVICPTACVLLTACVPRAAAAALDVALQALLGRVSQWLQLEGDGAGVWQDTACNAL
jgi:hypothetical protein